MVTWNYWTAVVGFHGNTVGGLSDVYDTLFTPAGYAFSIWGLIFIGQVLHAGYQLTLAFGGEESQSAAFFRDIGPWLLVTNVLNIAWTAFWLSEWTATSVFVLASMNVCLFIAMRRLRMEVGDAPLRVVVCVWWPIAVYAGWVAVAVLANLSAYLAKQGVVPGDSEFWAIAMISLATVYNLAMVQLCNLREHALVAVWAFVAIAVRQGGTSTVTGAALAGAAMLCVAVSAHAYRNRATTRTA
jgi:hypothetical protein